MTPGASASASSAEAYKAVVKDKLVRAIRELETGIDTSDAHTVANALSIRVDGVIRPATGSTRCG